MLGLPPIEPVVEGVDYTMEDGLLVFTRHYLLQRACCGNGCKNCPYGVNPGSMVPEEVPSLHAKDDVKEDAKHT